MIQKPKLAPIPVDSYLLMYHSAPRTETGSSEIQKRLEVSGNLTKMLKIKKLSRKDCNQVLQVNNFQLNQILLLSQRFLIYH